jgi:ABC-type nitrate/sulfonate/bicarbonate transport system substrate-binding protein
MKRRFLILASLLAAIALIASACGGGDEGSDGEDGEIVGSIRFAFSPDPAWDWIVDEGILAEMEAESGYVIQRFETEDEFAVFAGGHADVVSTGSYETPELEAETGVATVTFGKYNRAKDIMVADDESGYATLDDLPEGCLVGAEAFGGSTNVWAALAADLHGRTLADGTDDMQIVVTDFELAPELVVEGDLCAGITAMTTSIPYLQGEDVTVLYDGRGASELYAEQYEPGHEGMMSNNFVTLESWYDDHPGEIAFFLEVWQRALEEFNTNRDAVIDAYPEHFGYQNDEEKQFVIDWYNNVFNEFVDDVYLTEEWINGEAEVTEILRRAQLIPDDQPLPIHVCIGADSGEETCRVGG